MRKREFKHWNIVFIIAACVVIVIIIILGIMHFKTRQLQQIENDNEVVVGLMEEYFNGDKKCTDFEAPLMKNGEMGLKEISEEAKEATILSRLAQERITGISYTYLNEAYHNLFGNDSDIEPKEKYEVVGADYIFNTEDELYYLDKYCSSPERALCFFLDKAYKSDSEVKLIVGVMTRDIKGANHYNGIVSSGEEGEKVDTSTEEFIPNLPKWEVWFRYNNKLGKFILDKTVKI